MILSASRSARRPAGRPTGGCFLPFLCAAALSGAAATAHAAPDGAALFAQNCSACHQAAGQGIPGAFPALAGDVLVQGPVTGAANVVLNGRGGMPAFGGYLSDETIASVLTFVRSSWGNKAPPITPDGVASVRANTGADHPKNTLQAH